MVENLLRLIAASFGVRPTQFRLVKKWNPAERRVGGSTYISSLLYGAVSGRTSGARSQRSICFFPLHSSSASEAPYTGAMTLDLADDEARALARHLHDALDYARYPFSPRLDPLKSVLAKLDPPKPRLEPLPSLKPGAGPIHGQGRRRR